MALDLHQFVALTFDCYGTLIDWERGILDALRPWRARSGVPAADGELLARFAECEARQEAATPTMLYPRILEAVFQDLARSFDSEPDPAETAAFGESVPDWPAFADSHAALAYLQRHYKLVIISNIDRRSFAASQARLGVKFDAVITAEEVGSYKPDPRNFEYAFARLAEAGIERERILHVAQSLYHDHEPAKRLGVRTVWVNRRAGQCGWGATQPPQTDVQPDLVVTDLAGLAALHRDG
jgi:2-haloalkanoic acid dehalogenase type II